MPIHTWCTKRTKLEAAVSEAVATHAGTRAEARAVALSLERAAVKTLNAHINHHACKTPSKGRMAEQEQPKERTIEEILRRIVELSLELEELHREVDGRIRLPEKKDERPNLG
jgi:hypothetical protein